MFTNLSGSITEARQAELKMEWSTAPGGALRYRGGGGGTPVQRGGGGGTYARYQN